MSTAVTTEYRVETRRKPEHPSGSGEWYPEGRVLATRVRAEQFLREKQEWYGSPRYFEHRVTARAVTNWMPVAPTVEFPS